MDYFDWLCMIAIPDGGKRADYALVLITLMEVPFRWYIRRDENRALDGLELRDIYEDETGEVCDQDGECTVLEMMVALAIRCNDEIMYDPDDPKRADRWFWVMIENLGLDVFEKKVAIQGSKTSTFDSDCDAKNEILDILDEFMAKNGCKWLFSKKKHPPNFDKMELWYQLNHYLMDHFGANFG